MMHDSSRSVTVEVKRKRRRFGRGAPSPSSAPESPVENDKSDKVVDQNQVKRGDQDYKSSDILAQDEQVTKKPKVMNQKFEAPKEQESAPVAAKQKHKPKTNYVKKVESSEAGADGAFKDKLGLKDNAKHGAINKRRSSNKVLIQNIDLEGDDLDRRSTASIKRAREKARREREGAENASEKRVHEVVLPEVITVSELAQRMAEKSKDVIKEFMKLGVMVNLSQVVDADTAELVITELGHKVKRVSESDVENILEDNDQDDQKISEPRCPVVTIMGHVDHGKTSLLDAIRSASVTSGEAGGITQHIGAYQVSTKGGAITFLDTPGHEAFSAMRSKGAKITDIVILVVAADDGVKEQTKEAISHAKAAGVPIIVAVNKIDKPEADPSRVINELLNYDIVAESMGGDTMTVEVSAVKKLNLDQLLESILLQSEVLELKAPVQCKPRGVVIEASLDKSKGVVATILVQRGHLKVGDLVVVGSSWGKIKAMYDDKGRKVAKAGPSMPVRVFGLNSVPDSGDHVDNVTEEKQARDIADYRYRKQKEKESVSSKKVSLEDLFAKAQNSSEEAVLPVILKADVHGSLEAIEHSLSKISTDDVSVKVLHKGVGGINESDVSLAKAANAVIVGFNVRVVPQARIVADSSGVDIRYYSIIYNLIDEFKALMSGLLSPIAKEVYLGRVEIREVFTLSKGITVAGSFVTDGLVKRGAKVRLLRDSTVIHEGALRTLRRFKDDVKEVKHGYECGIALEGYNDIKVGDVVEVYEIVEEQRTL